MTELRLIEVKDVAGTWDSGISYRNVPRTDSRV